MAVITSVDAWEVLDSRGWPTVAVAVVVEHKYRGWAMVPSGASTGTHEALELRDGDVSRYLGRGVLQACANVRGELAGVVVGRDPYDQLGLDEAMFTQDGTPGCSRLGANAVLGVSLATARAAAHAQGVPLYRYLGGGEGGELPLPMVNLISGGQHAGNNLQLQDVLLMPVGASSYRQALEQTEAVRSALAECLAEAGRATTGVADEGGFGPRLSSHEEALQLVTQAMERAGMRPGRDAFIGLDVAANEFYRDGTYHLSLDGLELSGAGMVDLLAAWCDRYPILSIEDGMAEDDEAGWQALTQRLGDRVQLIGDDLFVTQLERLRHGINHAMANAVLIKLNQNGSLSGTLTVLKEAQRRGYLTVVSARSGETEDPFMADLAVATRAGQIKIGSITRSERLAKYNRLLAIEREAANGESFAGRSLFARFLFQ